MLRKEEYSNPTKEALQPNQQPTNQPPIPSTFLYSHLPYQHPLLIFRINLLVQLKVILTGLDLSIDQSLSPVIAYLLSYLYLDEILLYIVISMHVQQLAALQELI